MRSEDKSRNITTINDAYRNEISSPDDLPVMGTTFNSSDIETILKNIFSDFNNTQSFTGVCEEVEFDKVALCTDETEEYMKGGGHMKLTYQLGTINFNIKFLKCVSEIRIINDYEMQEVEKRLDKEMDESNLKCTIGSEFPNIPPMRIYGDYEKDCKTLEIYIDEKLYKCSNYELIKSGSKPCLLSSPKYRITIETQEKFDIFQTQAENLLKAFKEL